MLNNLKNAVRFISKFSVSRNVFLSVATSLFLLRVAIAINGYHGTDIVYHLTASRGIVNGQLLYRDVRFDYPPLHAFFQAFFLLAIGDNVIAAKMPAFIGDVFCLWILYLICKKRDVTYGRKIVLCYLTFPLTILTSAWYGLFDSVAMALTLAGIYYSDKRSDWLAAALFGVGTMYKPFSFLSVFPILIQNIIEKRWKTFLLYIGIIGLICAVVSFPFFYVDPIATIGGYLYNSGKIPNSFSIFNVLHIRSKELPFAIQGVVLVISYLSIVYKFGVFKNDRFENVTLFSALFIMLNKNIYPHYFFWVFPFLAYWYICNNKLTLFSYVLLIDTLLCGLYWKMPVLTETNMIFPLTFQAVNWSAIGYAIMKAKDFMFRAEVFPQRRTEASTSSLILLNALTALSMPFYILI